MTDTAPTPWAAHHVVTGLGNGFYRVWDADARVISAFLLEEDAHMIAAAPEMLAAMKSADKWLSKADPSFAIEQARGFLEQAIKTAEGRDA